MLKIYFLVSSALNKRGHRINKKNDNTHFDLIDMKILNLIQKDFSISRNPFLDMALKINSTEDVVLEKVKTFIDNGVLTRVGPFFNMDKSSGYVSLVAMVVPEEKYELITALVNNYEEVAHNYKRDHRFNMWFVIAGANQDKVLQLLLEIEVRSGIKTFNFPKLKEFNLDLFFEVD